MPAESAESAESTAPAAPTVIVRSLPGRLGALVVGAGALWAVLTIWAADGARNGVQALAWGGLVTLAVWALWWAPQLRLDADRLTIRNAWRTHIVAWEAIETCRTRWALEIVTTDGAVVRAAAAQRAGGLRTSLRRRQALRRAESTGRGADWEQVHSGVREDFLTGEGAYRTGMDSEQAGDLIEAYAERRTQHGGIGPGARSATGAPRADPREGAHALNPDSRAPRTPRPALRSQWNRPPLILAAVLCLLLAATALA